MFTNDTLRDDGLQSMTDAAGSGYLDLYICSAEPATYAEATSTYALGDKNGIAVSAPTDGDASGRKVVISAITDGDVTATDTATHFAVVNTDDSSLVLAQALSSPVSVTSGNTFTLSEIDVTAPDPA